ncbi:phenylacetate--CoA ligase [Chitinispirillum alkaliphilum]|nr:phenylacetate--CoA ligase [Chitinispirillum alkaliphilum]
MLFNPDFSWEFLSEEQIISKTLRALRNHIAHLIEISPHYRDLLNGLDPKAIETPEDFSKIPFVDRKTLCSNYNDFRAVSNESIVETVVSSAGKGKMKQFPFTKNDLERLAYGNALSFHRCGISKDDTVLIMTGLESPCFLAMACYRGLVALGANAVRAGIGVSGEKLKYYLDNLQPDVIIGEPSTLKSLGVELEKTGYSTVNSSVKKLVCTRESIRTQSMELNSIALEMERIWGASVFSIYNTTEISAPFCDCPQSSGLHVIPELLYPEIVDLDGNPVADGTPGELVLTPLGVEGMPLLRYKSGDISFKISGNCACGRNSFRIGPVLGRKEQLIRKSGKFIYPLTLINTLDEVEGINDYVIVLEDDNSKSDRVSVHVAAPTSMVETVATKLRGETGEFYPILISNVNTIRALREKSLPNERILDWRIRSR